MAPAVLEACVRDVHYEVERYCTWATQTVPYSNAITEMLLAEATFESAVLHLRNLVDFLANPRPKVGSQVETDLVADHYFDTGWTGRPRPFLLFDDTSTDRNDYVRRNVQRHLVHLTTARHAARVSQQRFTWEWNRVLVLDGFERFVNDLRTAGHVDRARWFDHTIDQAVSTRRRLVKSGDAGSA